MKLRNLVWCSAFVFLAATAFDVYAEETDVETPVIEEQSEFVVNEIQSGWDSTHSSYTKEDGTLAVGWCQIDGATYYFNESGILQKNQWITDKYVGTDGILVTNQWIGDRFVDASGNWVKNNWVYDNGWKFCYADGSFAVNKLDVIDGSTYYFNTDGFRVTNWQMIDGNWYYFNESGAMVTEHWCKITMLVPMVKW